MNDANQNLSLWRSSDQQEFFLVDEPVQLPGGTFEILNGEGETLLVAYESLAPFAVKPKDAVRLLEESINAHAESIIGRNKELKLLPTEPGKQGTIDLDLIKVFLRTKEAKKTVRSLAAALRRAADKIERSPANIEKSMGELFAKFMGEIEEEEQKSREKNDEERKTRIGIAVKDSIANALKDLNIK